MAYSTPSRMTPGGTPEVPEDDPLLELSRIVDMAADAPAPAAASRLSPLRPEASDGDPVARVALQKLAAAQRHVAADAARSASEPAPREHRTVLPAAAPRVAPAGNGASVMFAPKPQTPPYPPVPPMSRTNLKPAPGSIAERQVATRRPEGTPAPRPATAIASSGAAGLRQDHAPANFIEKPRVPAASHDPAPSSGPFLPPVPDYSPEALRAKLAAPALKTAQALQPAAPSATASARPASVVDAPSPAARTAPAAAPTTARRPFVPAPVFDFEEEIEQAAKAFEPAPPMEADIDLDFEAELLAEMDGHSGRTVPVTTGAPVFDDTSIVAIPEDGEPMAEPVTDVDEAVDESAEDLTNTLEMEFAAFETAWTEDAAAQEEHSPGAVEGNQTAVFAERAGVAQGLSLEDELDREFAAAANVFAGHVDNRSSGSVVETPEATDDVSLSLEDEMLEALRGNETPRLFGQNVHDMDLSPRSPDAGGAHEDDGHMSVAMSDERDPDISVEPPLSMAAASDDDVDDPWASDEVLDPIDIETDSRTTPSAFADADTIDWEAELPNPASARRDFETEPLAAVEQDFEAAEVERQLHAADSADRSSDAARRSLAEDLQSILDEMATRFARPGSAATAAAAVPAATSATTRAILEMPVDVTDAVTEIDHEARPVESSHTDAHATSDDSAGQDAEVVTQIETGLDAFEEEFARASQAEDRVEPVDADTASDLGFHAETESAFDFQDLGDQVVAAGPVEEAISDDEVLVAELSGDAQAELDIVDWLSKNDETAIPARQDLGHQAGERSLEDELAAVLGDAAGAGPTTSGDGEKDAFRAELDRVFASAAPVAAARAEEPRIKLPRATPRPPANPVRSLEDELELAFGDTEILPNRDAAGPAQPARRTPLAASAFGEPSRSGTIPPSNPVVRPIPERSTASTAVPAVTAVSMHDNDLLDALELEFASAVAEIEAPVLETTPIDSDAVHHTDELELPEIDTNAHLPAQPADEFEHEFADTFREFEQTRSTASADSLPSARPAAAGTAAATSFGGDADLFEKEWADERQHWAARNQIVAEEPDQDSDGDVPAAAVTEGGNGRRGLMLASIAGGVALLGAVAALAYTWGGGADVDAPPTIIKADSGPIKVQPDDPGGKAIPNQDKVVYSQVRGTDTSAPSQEKLVDTAEEPALVDRRAAVPVEPASDSDVLKENERVDIEAADAGPGVIEPRRVRTMVVRPDGTIVEREPVVAEPASSGAAESTAATVDATTPVDEVEASVSTDIAAADPVGDATVDAEVQPLPGEVAAVMGESADNSATMVDATGTPLPGSGEPKSEERLGAPEAEATAAPIPAADVNPQAVVAPPEVAAVSEPEAAPVPAGETATDSADELAEPLTAAAVEPVAAAEPEVAQIPAPAPAPARPARAPQPQQQAAAPATAAAPVTSGGGGYVVQIASHPTPALAQDSAANLSRKFGSVIGGRGVTIQKANIDGKGTFYRVRIAAGSRAEATELCGQIKAAGGSCFVAR